MGDDGIERDEGLDGLLARPLQMKRMTLVEGGGTHRVVNLVGQSPTTNISTSSVPLSSPKNLITKVLETEVEESVGDFKARNIKQTKSL